MMAVLIFDAQLRSSRASMFYGGGYDIMRQTVINSMTANQFKMISHVLVLPKLLIRGHSGVCHRRSFYDARLDLRH